jgi:tetrahydromethanopterin S-methyltransferase subunit E
MDHLMKRHLDRSRAVLSRDAVERPLYFVVAVVVAVAVAVVVAVAVAVVVAVAVAVVVAVAVASRYAKALALHSQASKNAGLQPLGYAFLTHRNQLRVQQIDSSNSRHVLPLTRIFSNQPIGL